MKLLLLHNETAGTGDVEAQELRATFGAAGFDVTYRHHSKHKLKDAELRAADVLVVAGGDGTVADALRMYRGRVPHFAIVPLGTANNIAASLGIEGTAEAIAIGLHDARELLLDIGLLRRAQGSAEFIEGVGAGAIVAAMQEADRDHMPGDANHERCLRLIPEFIARAEPRRWQCHVDGQPLPAELLLIEVMNSRLVGPSLQPAATAEPGDGMLDVAFLRPERRAEMLQAMAGGEMPRPLPLEHLRGREVTLRLHDTPLRIDDRFEAVEATPQDMTLTMAPPPIRILAPRRAGNGN